MQTEYTGDLAAQDRARVLDILEKVEFARFSDYGRTMRALNDLIEDIRLEAEGVR
jgi:hypothetical protein